MNKKLRSLFSRIRRLAAEVRELNTARRPADCRHYTCSHCKLERARAAQWSQAVIETCDFLTEAKRRDLLKLVRYLFKR